MSTALTLSQPGRDLQHSLQAHLLSEMRSVLPPAMRPERLIMSIVQAGERLPALYECSPQSLMMAALTAATLGLEVDGVTGQAYLIPFRQKGRPLAQLVVGYKGYSTLAARNGWTITGAVVREGDVFDYALGTAPQVQHRPKDRNTKANITHAYAIARHAAQPPIVEVMDIDEIMATKSRSPGAKRSDSPWNDAAIGFPAMAGKTPKRRLARSMPMGWVNAAAVMEDQWDLDRPAYVQIDEDDRAPVVHLATEYAAEPLRPGPDDGVLSGDVVQDWVLHTPGRDPAVYPTAAAWAAAMEKKMIAGAKSPRLGEFWQKNAVGLAALGEVDEAAAQRLVQKYQEIAK